MDKSILEKRINNAFVNATISIDGEGCNLGCTVVSESFEDVPLLKRQQQILALVNEEIKSGELHALSIKARTPAEMS